MKLYKDGQLVGEFSTTELKELAGVDIEKAAEVAAGAVEVKSFEVGDKVEVIGKSIIGRDEFIGKTAVIARIYGDGDIEIDEGGYDGAYRPSALKLIEEEPEEVLSYENVKEGEYFVITDNSNGHRFATGEVIKAKGAHITQLKAERMDEAYWWFVYYADVRRATDAEIAEATKPKFEIGDVVKVGAFDFATITQDIDPDGDYPVKYIENGSFNFAEPSNIRHATEEEKSHLQTLIGREKDEYKIGDLVELLDGFGGGYRGRSGYIFEVDSVDETLMLIHLKDNGNKTSSNSDTWSKTDDLKLITPVEWRHDFVKEVK